MGDAELVSGEAHLAQARERFEGAKGGKRQLATLGHCYLSSQAMSRI
jgi:hypothetical protein